MKRFAWILPALVLVACDSVDHDAVAVQDQAAHDFRCPRDQVDVQSLDLSQNDSAYCAAGCGHIAAYECALGACSESTHIIALTCGGSN